MRKFYYPDNLTAVKLYKYWTITDLFVMVSIFAFSIIMFLSLHIWFFIAFLPAYAFLSARFVDYSVIRLFVLFIRFLFTDVLILEWRR